MRRRFQTEWPTWVILMLCWSGWIGILLSADTLGALASTALLALCLGLYSSLQHEILHGHPTASEPVNTLIALPPLGVFIPYPRFKDLHLAHHRNDALTDPYDDPESYYVHPEDWARFPGLWQVILQINNTLVGRILIGPALGLCGFWQAEFQRMRRGDRAVLRAWGLQFLLLVPLGAFVWLVSALPIIAYLVAAYAGMSIIHVRTFVEHRAHPEAAARTVIIEDRGLFALLFLNNNFHAVHHVRPSLPWYEIPAFYARHRDRILARNRGYRYRSYADVFRLYAFRPKEPVPHPLVGQDSRQ
ncbi:MAG: fatty acid desaturase [Pseudomonadota bacterium]